MLRLRDSTVVFHDSEWSFCVRETETSDCCLLYFCLADLFEDCFSFFTPMGPARQFPQVAKRRNTYVPLHSAVIKHSVCQTAHRDCTCLFPCRQTPQKVCKQPSITSIFHKPGCQRFHCRFCFSASWQPELVASVAMRRKTTMRYERESERYLPSLYCQFGLAQ